jgi:hypothetical protein
VVSAVAGVPFVVVAILAGFTAVWVSLAIRG